MATNRVLFNDNNGTLTDKFHAFIVMKNSLKHMILRRRKKWRWEYCKKAELPV